MTQLDFFPAPLGPPLRMPVTVSIGFPDDLLISFTADPNSGTITIVTDCAEDITFPADNFDLMAELLVRAATND